MALAWRYQIEVNEPGRFLAKIPRAEATFPAITASPHMSDGIQSPFQIGERELHMRSVRIAAAAGIVATGLALGAAGIASAATPNTAPAPAPAKTAPAQAKTVPAKTLPAKAVPGKAVPARIHAKPAPARTVQLPASKVRALAEARAAHAKTAHVTRANYVVTASHLNVRTGPGTKYRVAGTLAKGAQVVADTKIVNGFRQLSNGNWVSAHYLKAAR